MFNTIVVGVNGSDGGRDAIALARTLASESSDIVLVASFPYETSPNRGSITGHAELMADDTHTMLESAAAGTSRCRTRVMADWSPARALHQVAEQEHAELIVVGSAHRGPIGRLLLGDVSRATLYGAPCPVAVAPRGLHKHSIGPISAIGVGLNSTRESDAALAMAAEFAAQVGASLQLLTAVAMPAAMASTYEYAYDWTDVEADSRRVATQQLAEIKASLDVPVDTVVVCGNAGSALQEMSQHVDLIVAGSRGWGAVKSVVLGSTTDRLVHHAHCPVLVVPSPVDVPAREEAVHA